MNESFPPASDHIPHAGKMVVGGDGEVMQYSSCAVASTDLRLITVSKMVRIHRLDGKLRPGASALPVGWRVGGRGRGVGLRPTNLVVPGGVSKQTSTQPTRSGILIRIQKHQG